MTASYVPEGARIADELLALDGPLRVFYDLDTPVTLQQLQAGRSGLSAGASSCGTSIWCSPGPEARRCDALRARLRREAWRAPLFGCVDPDVYRRVRAASRAALRAELHGHLRARTGRRSWSRCSWSRRGGGRRGRFCWPGRCIRRRGSGRRMCSTWSTCRPADHPALYSSSRLTLNLTREAMAASGYCPSGRFFEAAACGTPIVTDWFRGLDSFL